MTSGIVRLETAMVLASRIDISPRAAQGQFDKFLRSANVEEIAIDPTRSRAAPLSALTGSAGVGIPRD